MTKSGALAGSGKSHGRRMRSECEGRVDVQGRPVLETMAACQRVAGALDEEPET